ncbi:hypothetical protein CLV80_102417 [Yoonia maritima]|uniref:TadE-like protein n=1 Tax=Yoonia maritima TaxID=1435347 RepID=A0A2T0W3J1_9RHOB|nr:hypothetical protein CLV80_102417 [Yoonia maritima]
MIKLLNDLRRDEDGIASVELVLSIPILVWALLSTHVYFDAFKAESLSTRANLTVSDMFSREAEVNDDYITGAHSLLEQLSDGGGAPSLRITSYYFDAGNPDTSSDDEYVLVWSQERGDEYVPHTQASLDAVSHRIPIMSNNDKSFLVETHISYTAPFSIGIGPFIPTKLEGIEFSHFTPIRSRFEGELCYVNSVGLRSCAPVDDD